MGKGLRSPSAIRAVTGSNGFTLVELVLVVTLIAILAVTVVPLVTQPLKLYNHTVKAIDTHRAAVVFFNRLDQDLQLQSLRGVEIDASGNALKIVTKTDIVEYSVVPDQSDHDQSLITRLSHIKQDNPKASSLVPLVTVSEVEFTWRKPFLSVFVKNGRVENQQVSFWRRFLVESVQ